MQTIKTNQPILTVSLDIAENQLKMKYLSFLLKPLMRQVLLLILMIRKTVIIFPVTVALLTLLTGTLMLAAAQSAMRKIAL